VDTAKEEESGIKLEKLKGIRRSAKSRRTFRYSLHSWSFYQLQDMIEYKAKLQGVPIEYVEPYHTSKECSRCGVVGNRNGKSFKCPECGHVDHADSNAAFNIAMRPSIDQSIADRDVMEGSTDIPQEAKARRSQPQNPPCFSGGSMSAIGASSGYLHTSPPSYLLFPPLVPLLRTVYKSGVLWG